MFAWLKSTHRQSPVVPSLADPLGSNEVRKSIATEADFDTSLRRAVQGTVWAMLALQHSSNQQLTKCARLLQMMRETTSNEVMHLGSGLPSLGQGELIANALNAFVFQLHFAERLTDAVSDIGQEEEADFSHRTLLIDAWAAAAANAMRLVELFARDTAVNDTRRGFFEMIGASLGLIRAYITHAPEYPPSILPSADRRIHKRSLLGVWVRTATSNSVGDAFLSDISVAGFGIATPLALTSGSEIEIEAPDGRILGAKVAWVQGTRAGARFFEPLDPDDKLITTSVTKNVLKSPMSADPLNVNRPSLKANVKHSK